MNEARAIAILEGALRYLRQFRRTRRGNYTATQRWFGAGNYWTDHGAKLAYRQLYDTLCKLKKNPRHRKNRKP